jgi:hypothetical protein
MKAWPDWDEFVRRLREDAAFREEVRRQVLTEDLLNLPAVVSRVLDLQRQTLEVLRGFMEAADRRFAALERDVRTLQGSVGRLTGRDFERRFLSRASRIFLGGGNLGAALRQAAGEALRAGVISRDEWQRLDSLDLLWGRGGTVFVGEVSEAVRRKDVFRALRAVEILRRLGWGRGLRLLPVVVGRKVGRVPKGVGWVRLDPDEEVLEISPGIETILREEGPEPVEPERFFGGGADGSPLREA